MAKPKASTIQVKSFMEDFTLHKRSFILSPTQWNSFQLATALKWEKQSLEAQNVALIPTTRGIYAHSISITRPNLPPTNYITYVGLVGDKKKKGPKGNDRHLQQRFREYLREADNLGRALVWGMLHQYKGFMFFHYAQVPDYSVRLHAVETALLDALLPPCNKEDFSINIGEAHRIVYGM